MFEVIGQSRYYSRNEGLIHETNLESRFLDNFFWIRVNEHYTSQHCYRKKPEKNLSSCTSDQPIHNH